MTDGLKITRQTRCVAVVGVNALREALILLGLPEDVEFTVAVRCDRGEIDLDDKSALVVNWTEPQR